MMSQNHDGAQLSSDAVALTLSGLALAVLLHAKVDSWTQVSAARANQIELSVQTEADAAPTPPAAPPPVQKPVPRRALPQARVAEIAAPAEPQQPSEPVPEGAALVASTAVAAPVSDAHPDLDAEYAAGLRADIDRRTHAPDSVQYRLRHPSGEVRVGFVVMRSGVAKAVRVLRSSGSSILDEAAQATVSSGHYPPLPDKAFAGETEHMFAVTIEFRRTN
jgi:protein TonB